MLISKYSYFSSKVLQKRRAMQFKLFYTDVIDIPFPGVVLNLSRLP